VNEAPACGEKRVREMVDKGECEKGRTDRISDGRLFGGGLVRERALGGLDRQVVDLELRRMGRSGRLVQDGSTREEKRAHLARYELANELAHGDEGGVRVGRLVDTVDDEAALEVLAKRGAVGETCTSDVCGTGTTESVRGTRT